MRIRIYKKPVKKRLAMIGNDNTLMFYNHCNKMHSALVIVCLFVVVAFHLHPETNLEKAIKQADQIQKALEKFNFAISPSFYVAKAWETTGIRDDFPHDQSCYVKAKENDHIYHLKIDKNYEVTHVFGLQNDIKRVPFGSASFGISDQRTVEFRTIGQFISFWNGLYNTHYYQAAYVHFEGAKEKALAVYRYPHRDSTIDFISHIQPATFMVSIT